MGEALALGSLKGQQWVWERFGSRERCCTVSITNTQMQDVRHLNIKNSARRALGSRGHGRAAGTASGRERGLKGVNSLGCNT